MIKSLATTAGMLSLIGGCGAAATDPHPQPQPTLAGPGPTADGDQAASGVGRLPPAVIQRVVRAHFADFRKCYEAGLTRNPNLTRRVMLRFVIGADGRVQSSSGTGDIPDEEVIKCAATAAKELTFPAPEGGVVTVSYPIVFTQDGDGTDPERKVETEKSGRLAPGVIQKHVRDHFGAFRTCYEAGLSKDPKLTGMVNVRFVIGTDGAVKSSRASGDIPDEQVKGCVAEKMKEVKFPPPQGGIVKVSYPIVFRPDAK